MREALRQREQATDSRGDKTTESPIGELITGYKQKRSEEILALEYNLLAAETMAIVLDLTPEKHDRQIEELLALMHERGLKTS